jgi:pimeloyl-ACP methyl ester carboxylesterase
MNPMPEPESRKRKFLTRATLIPLALLAIGVVLWLGAATLVTYRVLHPPFLDGGHGDVIVGSEEARANAQLGIDPKSCCDAPFEDLRITDDQGVSVDSWFVPGILPSAVLLIPPSGASKRTMLPYLKFLHAAGLPVLMIDSSDFERGRAGWGWRERGIVRSAAEVLRKRGYQHIAALGVSEGAATALMVQAETSDLFKVIVADSSFATLGMMLRQNPSLAGLNPAFLQTVMWELGLALGRSVDDISPARAASRIGRCALLVIQNAKDPLTQESDSGKIIAACANPSSGVYLTPSEGHGDAVYLDPQAYQKAVLDFLAHNLPGAAAITPH